MHMLCATLMHARYATSMHMHMHHVSHPTSSETSASMHYLYPSEEVGEPLHVSITGSMITSKMSLTHHTTTYTDNVPLC